jgi:hypothetical protein
LLHRSFPFFARRFAFSSQAATLPYLASTPCSEGTAFHGQTAREARAAFVAENAPFDGRHVADMLKGAGYPGVPAHELEIETTPAIWGRES